MTQGRRYYVEYNQLSHHNIINMIINFYQLYDKIVESKELTVYTSLPEDDNNSGEKIKITDIKKSEDGWEPFDIGKLRFELKMMIITYLDIIMVVPMMENIILN